MLTILSATLVLGYSPALKAAVLPDTVLELLAQHQIPLSAVSAQATDLQSGKNLVAHNTQMRRNPASVMKLVTTLAALELLGPAYAWQTKYFLDGELNDGVLNGNLVIQGHGDPYLVIDQFWLQLRALRELGLRQIKGNLLIDNSAFKLPPHNPGTFDNNPHRLYNVGPSATIVNFNASRFKLASEEPYVKITLDPPLENIIIDDQLRLKSGRCVAQENGWKMAAVQQQQIAKVTFSGHYSSGCQRYEYGRSVLSSEAYLYGLFKYLWQQLGGELAGGYAGHTMAKSAQPFYVGRGKNLAEAIVGANKYSNNLLAQQLLLSISAQADPAKAATRTHAIKQISRWLASKGILGKGLRIDNGSGLSRHIRLSSAALNKVLLAAWNSDYRPEFLASLSLVGIDGTARRRMRQSPGLGRVRIKTGYLTGVRTMATYIKTQSGQWIAANLMIESGQVNYANGNQIQDAFIEALLAQQ